MNKSKYHNRKKVFFIFLSLSLIVAISYFYTVEKRQVQLSNMVKYHTKMIKSGSISSLVELGKMYEKGEGVKKDLSKAQELFKKAINFNEYLDEIYPSYSELEPNEEEQHLDKKNKQLKKVIASVKFTEQEPVKSNLNLKPKNYQKPKYVPYVKTNKEPLNKNKKATKKTSKKISKKTVVFIDSPKNKYKAPIKSKSSKKVNSANNTVKKSSNPAKHRNTVSSKKSTAKKTTNVAYKKSVTIKRKPKNVNSKKPKLQAKRSPTLYEERPDYETDLGMFEDEAMNDSDDEEIIPVQGDIDKKQTLGSNFVSNPCATESAKYIAKCRRVKRKK